MKDLPPLTRDHFGRNWVGIVSYYIFHWREPLLAIGVLVTVALALSAARLELQAGFTKMLPLEHPYMQTFLKYQPEFGGANKVLVAVKARNGDIFNAEALKKLKGVHEDLFFTKGVERSSVLSLYSPNTIFLEVVEDGFRSGPVLPGNFKPSPEGFDELRANLLKSQWVGRIVASDFSAALVAVTLLDRDPETGARLDLKKVGADLERIRAKYEDAGFSIHVIGFAKSSADIAAGANGVILFFVIAMAITALLLYWYSGSPRLTALALAVALTPVVWLLGLLPLLGLTLDPMSILVPFLIFSIGVSHAVQMTNAWKLETLRGRDGVSAARIAFVKLFIPGASALLANAIGFLVIAFVKIEMVRELVFTATLGVTLMILTNKILLPILLSYMRIAPGKPRTTEGHETIGDPLWRCVARTATPRVAGVVIALAAVLLAGGIWKARDQVIGDLGRGVPELRADSRYNQDVDVIAKSFAIGIDVLQVIAQGDAPAACNRFEVLDAVDRFEFFMRQTEGVQSARGIGGFTKLAAVGYSEGDVKWAAIPDTREQRNQSVMFSTRGGGDLVSRDCSAMNVSIFTRDHQAATLAHIVAQVNRFKESFDDAKLRFELASGNAGVMAATNEVVRAADHWVNWALFGAVALLCLITFRSLAITLCIVIPLGVVTVLCYALMAALGIGMKVNTLPVVALGVGVGVDYGIYLFEVIRHEMKSGAALPVAFHEALRQRGTASLFTAVTMTVGVGTWLFSQLQFQADMGILLAFMFMVNAFGAILLAPALATFLLRAPARVVPVTAVA